MKAKYQKGGRLTKRRDKLTDKADALIPGYEKDRVTKRVGKLQNKINVNMNKKKFKKFGTPLNKKSINSFRQKGGKVKPSLEYQPGFPATGNKPSPYDLKTLKKAITRDSTKVADRSFIGDFLDPGVTSGSTGSSDQYNLQINREFRDKETGSSSKQTAKKINTMKSKKQMGGSVAERMRNAKGNGLPGPPPKKITGQETKDLGKTQLKVGRKNRRTAKGMKGEYALKAMAKDQRQAGRALKKKGRQMKRGERQDRMEAEIDKTEGWLKSGGEAKRLDFGKPKMQSGGKVSGAKTTKGYDYRADSSDASKDMSNKELLKINKRNRTKRQRADAQGGQGDYRKPTAQEQRDFYDSGKGNYDTARQSPGERYNRAIRQSDAQDMPTKTVTSLTRGKDNKSLKKQKGGMKYGKGGMKNKKFQFGGLMGAVGGMKGAEGGFGQKLMGAAKGALGGGMLGRVAGGIKGAMGGGGLQGAMQGFKGGAFGNSNPMGGGGDAATGDGVQQAETVPGAMQRGGLRDRRNANKAKHQYKKSVRRRKSNNGTGLTLPKLGKSGKNCIKGDC